MRKRIPQHDAQDHFDTGERPASFRPVPNAFGTAPAVLGYTVLIILWNRRPETALRRRLRDAG